MQDYEPVFPEEITMEILPTIMMEIHLTILAVHFRKEIRETAMLLVNRMLWLLHKVTRTLRHHRQSQGKARRKLTEIILKQVLQWGVTIRRLVIHLTIRNLECQLQRATGIEKY